MLKKHLAIFIVFMLALFFAGQAYAQTALDQMKLPASWQFLTRTHYLSYDYAKVVLEEALATSCHSDRLLLSQQVLDSSGPSKTTERIAVGISRNNEVDSVILGTVVVDPDPNLTDSSATDTAIFNAIEDQWNTVAKCESGS